MELTELEQAVLTMLLAGDDATLVLLRAQLNAATIVSRKMPGVGFFTDFHVPEVVERTAPKDFVTAKSSGRQNLASLRRTTCTMIRPAARCCADVQPVI